MKKSNRWSNIFGVGAVLALVFPFACMALERDDPKYSVVIYTIDAMKSYDYPKVSRPIVHDQYIELHTVAEGTILFYNPVKVKIKALEDEGNTN